ncbi:hypothetical protein BDEG_24058 [Batrachochytrium dendrobatidis JEL423]|uniref:N-alpha-acetyltransferase 40 n=1 Tax=Batrachochytrium dendrobatidis (strain JEL423) TaxID=403673 RepID=A0A177WJJ7_BATDL|nr:hypothetical protein BDEG_24058 [Batrachochytrium dendrobatidis JEL423]
MCSKDIDWAFHLVKTNMEQYYRQSRDMGWLDASKYKEMTEEDARYIVLILKSSQTPVGFIHCRFTIDDDLDPITHEQTQLAVIYCYEIQLDTLVQRKGLGRALMTAMESLGRLHQMQKCKLTVFKHNPTAMAFYTSIGYVVDCTSPSMHMSEKRASRVSYEIMSKRLLDT